MAKEFEVTDTIEEIKQGKTAEEFKSMKIKKGRTLTFNYEGSMTVLEITRTTRDGRYFAKEIELHEPNTVASHYGHNVDATQEASEQYGAPYCTDCEIPVSDKATLEGKRKYQKRKEQYLSDGTFIGDDDED